MRSGKISVPVLIAFLTVNIQTRGMYIILLTFLFLKKMFIKTLESGLTNVLFRSLNALRVG